MLFLAILKFRNRIEYVLLKSLIFPDYKKLINISDEQFRCSLNFIFIFADFFKLILFPFTAENLIFIVCVGYP